MAKFPNPTSASNLINRLKPNTAPKRIWFAVLNQPKGSIHRFEIVDKKYSSGIGIHYLEGKCIESSNPDNLGNVLRLEKNGPIIQRSNVSAMLAIDTHIGGKFAIEYKHNTQNAYLIKDPGE